MIIDILKSVEETSDLYNESEATTSNYEVKYNEDKGEIDLNFVEVFYIDTDIETGAIETSIKTTKIETYSNKSLKDYCNLLIDLDRIGKVHNIIGDYV